MPALFTKMSILPKSFITSATTSAAELKLAASAAYAFAVPPIVAISFTKDSLRSSCFLTVNATVAPCFANSKAIPLPMPCAAPVISAIFPFNIINLLVSRMEPIL